MNSRVAGVYANAQQPSFKRAPKEEIIMPDGRNYVYRYTWDENGNIDTENVPDPFFDPLKTSITMVLTPYDDGTGTEPTPYEVELKVVGVLKEDQGKGYETSDGVMMDINALKALIQDLTGKTDTKFEYSSINVKAESLDAVSDVEQSIKDLGYSTYSMQSMRDELNKQTRQIELMLGGLGAISLLVAAIGITNTMIMSISERTKEIGIMKALGCYVRDIRAMFLMEAGFIGLIGGFIGSILSFFISVGMNVFTNEAAKSMQITDIGSLWTMITTAIRIIAIVSTNVRDVMVLIKFSLKSSNKFPRTPLFSAFQPFIDPEDQRI